MLLVRRDTQDRIIGCLEYLLVNEQGQPDPSGRYVFVNQLEINPSQHSHLLIRHFIHQIATLCPEAVGAYWERRDKPKNRLHAFRREQLVKGGMRNAPV